MYNERIKTYIDKYRDNNKYNEEFREKNRAWSSKCFLKMKEENGERYMKKKENARIRYYINIKENNEDKFNIAINKLKLKNINLYNKILELQ